MAKPAASKGLRNMAKGTKGDAAVVSARRNKPTPTTAAANKATLGAPKLPRMGPRAVPTADMVPSTPMALTVCDFGTASPTNAMVSAMLSAIMTAAPSPCATRAAMSSPRVYAMPHRRWRDCVRRPTIRCWFGRDAV